ncbi:DUF2490 domain-containing protein [Polaribacter gangjinensis]|uniref:DUF2490 domain-containing protein n=1 Tax=Polaribacter gangjinensis TaxID=574710 RepID=A0A2S7WDM6_9FLAO|nr:DUF2490 domain-containing protein [Polaribacter gangjinensis]PQJ75730.1 hypothetical protein BTO13_11065 [Polaribacter gangjinensis]
MKTQLINFSKLFFAFLLINSSLFAQDETDFGSWNSIGVDYTIKKKLKLNLEYNMRFKENAKVLEERFTEIGAEYKIYKKFELGGSVRFIDENDTQGNRQGIRKHFRYQFDLSYKYKFNKLSINHRFRYQNKNEVAVSELEGDIPNANIRFRTGVDYNFKKWPLDPEFDAEIFRRVSKDEKNQFTKYRLTFGTKYKWKNFGEFGINYRYERSLIDGNLPMNLDVIELRYRYSIN